MTRLLCSLSGNPPLSFRGAKRRGNPYLFRQKPAKSAEFVRFRNGLPRQCAHWLAMTDFFDSLKRAPSRVLFLPLQEPLPAGRAPARSVEIAAHGVAHDLELGADVGGLDQQLRLVIVGHEELHDAGAILRGRHAAVCIHEADVLRRAAVQRPGLGRKAV